MNPQQKPLLISLGILFLAGLAYITYTNRPVMDLNDNTNATGVISFAGEAVPLFWTFSGTEMACTFPDGAKPGQKMNCNSGTINIALHKMSATDPTRVDTIAMLRNADGPYICSANEVLVYQGGREYETKDCTEGINIGDMYQAVGILSNGCLESNPPQCAFDVKSIREAQVAEIDPGVTIAVGEPNPSAPVPKNDNNGDQDEEEQEEEIGNKTTTTTTSVTINPAPTTPSTSSKTYSLADIATHAGTTSCWAAVSGNVYDLTEWANRHPGGEKPILNMCGKDATSNFDRKHGGSNTAKAALVLLKIGVLK